MGTVNKKKVSKVETEKHLNYMGGAAYFLSDPIKTLRIAASSCFFGEPKYYTDGVAKKPRRDDGARSRMLTAAEIKSLRATLNALDPVEWRTQSAVEALVSAIDKALDHNPEAALQEADRLRNEDHIRVTPQVILVRAAHHPKVRGSQLVRQYAPKILKRVDEVATQLAYQLAEYGEKATVPNSLKRAWADFLERQSEYHLAKYRMESKGVKLVDVVNLAHPKSNEALSKLMKGTLKLDESTWESLISSKGSSTATWTEAIEKMGHMALLRNLRNLLDNKVDPKLFLDKLTATAKDGKQLPFRYYSAFKAVGDRSGVVKDAIESCIETVLENVPKFPGRLMALCDNSGSAQSATTSSLGTVNVSTIANLTAVVAAARADEGYVGVFGDQLKVFQTRKKSSLFDQLDKAEQIGRTVGGSTENGIWLFWDKAIKEKEHWDNVFVFSDMQAGHGGLYGTSPSSYSRFAWSGDPRYIDVSKLINEYRSTVNPKVNVFLVQVAGYQDTILPEFYKRTFILGGWGEGLLRYAAEMGKLMDELPTQ